MYCISPYPIILLENCSSEYGIICRPEFFLNSGWLQLFSPSRKYTLKPGTTALQNLCSEYKVKMDNEIVWGYDTKIEENSHHDMDIAQLTARTTPRRYHVPIPHRKNCLGASARISPIMPSAIPWWQRAVPAIFCPKSTILTMRQYRSIRAENHATRPANTERR